MPTMTQVRSILPDRLKRARFTTIAKDPSYRRYFAAGDDSASIRTVLAHLYEAGGNARKLRDLERQARSRRSHNAAAHRRQTQQHVPPERDLWQEMVARERRQARLERFQERREEDLARRQRKVEDRRNHRGEQRFFNGQADVVHYTFRDAEHLLSTLERYLPRLQNGERLLLKFGNKFFTLSLEKYEDIISLINFWVIQELVPVDVSDEELVEFLIEKKEITIMRPHARMGANWHRAQGEFFPYIHDFECEELTNELANLGCWRTVDAENYQNNCLYNAFKSAGVSEAVLEAMKLQFLRRKIARKNIRAIAEEHALRVSIHSDGEKNVQVYGPEDGFEVQLALIKDHYIHYYRTKFNSFAVLNYDQLKDRKEWWAFKDVKRRDNNRGMLSIDLLRTVMQTDHLEPIDITTHGIFRTQFHDKFKSTDFKSLKFPSKYTSLFHPPRDGDGPYTGEAETTVEEEGKEDTRAHRRKLCELELEEPIDVDRLDTIIQYIEARCHGLKPHGEDRSHDKVREVLQYLVQMRSACPLKIAYHFKNGVGRLYAKGESRDSRSKSMQGCFKGLRAPLIGHVGHDIDIENSLPVITGKWLQGISIARKWSFLWNTFKTMPTTGRSG